VRTRLPDGREGQIIGLSECGWVNFSSVEKAFNRTAVGVKIRGKGDSPFGEANPDSANLPEPGDKSVFSIFAIGLFQCPCDQFPTVRNPDDQTNSTKSP
jgi:hypothetical protein